MELGIQIMEGNNMFEKYEGFVVKKDVVSNLYLITTDGSGSIPKELVGRYTSVGIAKSNIDLYKRSKKGVANAEKKLNQRS